MDRVGEESVEFPGSMDFLSTVSDSLKTLKEIQTAMNGHASEVEKLGEKWIDVSKRREKCKELDQKSMEYRRDILREVKEVNKEIFLLLSQPEPKMKRNDLSDQIRDMLDLNIALRRLLTQTEPNIDSDQASSSQSCEHGDFNVCTECNEVFRFKMIQAENVGPSGRCIDAAVRVNDSVVPVGGVTPRGPPLECPDHSEKLEETLEKKVTNTGMQLINAMKEEYKEEEICKEVNVRDIGDQTGEFYPKRKTCTDCVSKTSATREPVVQASAILNSTSFETAENLAMKLAIGGEQVTRVDNTEDTFTNTLTPETQFIGETSRDTVEHGSAEDDYAQLVKELEEANLVRDKLREETVIETLTKLQKLRVNEKNFTQKSAKLAKSLERSPHPANDGDAVQALILHRNIEFIQVRVKTIQHRMDFVKLESEIRLAEINCSYESKALVERQHLAKAVRELSLMRKYQAAVFRNLENDEPF